MRSPDGRPTYSEALVAVVDDGIDLRPAARMQEGAHPGEKVTDMLSTVNSPDVDGLPAIRLLAAEADCADARNARHGFQHITIRGRDAEVEADAAGIGPTRAHGDTAFSLVNAGEPRQFCKFHTCIVSAYVLR